VEAIEVGWLQAEQQGSVGCRQSSKGRLAAGKAARVGWLQAKQQGSVGQLQAEQQKSVRVVVRYQRR